jgi:histone acetyltransferase (RNA polymerase elongator complex component)
MTIATNPLIRDFTIQDAVTVREIAHENFENSTSNGFYTEDNCKWYKNRWSMEAMDELSKEQQAGTRIILVAEINSEIVGVAGLVDKDIRMVFTKLNWQRQGIGTSIIQKIEEIAKQKGLTLLTVTSSLNAVTFYQKFCFHQTGFETQNDPEKGTRVLMEKLLV